MDEQVPAVPESERVWFGPWANAFLGTVKATGDFAEALRVAGYDPLKPADTYPAAVFVSLVGLVRRGLFPDLPLQEGYRRLGRRHVASLFEKGTGKLMALAFPLLGPDRIMKGFEDFPRRTGNFLRAAVTKEGDRHWRMVWSNTAGFPPEYLAGGLEYAFERVRVPTRKVVVEENDLAKEVFVIDVTW